jgi:hypothetical protein
MESSQCGERKRLREDVQNTAMQVWPPSEEGGIERAQGIHLSFVVESCLACLHGRLPWLTGSRMSCRPKTLRRCERGPEQPLEGARGSLHASVQSCAGS